MDAVSIAANDVTAILVTRGDVDLSPILDSLVFRNVVVWDNSRLCDRGVFGRYEAVECAITGVVYTQDDDCVVDPEVQLALLDAYEPGVLTVNMNPQHNGDAMPLLALLGWGSVFDARSPERAFAQWERKHAADMRSREFLTIGCDIVFPVLTPSRMLHLGHENLPYAWASNRTHLQPGYQERKGWYYREAAKLRTAPLLDAVAVQR